MLRGAGYPDTPGALSNVAKHIGVPAMTLRRWYTGQQNPPPNQMVTDKKEDLADLFEQAARLYLGHAIKADVIEETRGKDAVIASATATDKMQLLRGLPTEIIQIIPLLVDTVKALTDAGLDPSEVFNNLIAHAHEQVHSDSSD